MSRKIVMFNPVNQIKIVTTQEFKRNWERLGFVESSKIILFSQAS